MGDEEKKGIFGDKNNPFDGSGEGNKELGGIKNPFASQAGQADDTGNDKENSGTFFGNGKTDKDKGGIFGGGSLFGNGENEDVNKEKKDKMLQENPFATLSKKSEKSDVKVQEKEGKSKTEYVIYSFIIPILGWTAIAFFTVKTGKNLYRLQVRDTGEGLINVPACYLNLFLPININEAPFGAKSRIPANGCDTIPSNAPDNQYSIYKPTQSLLKGYIAYWFIEATKYTDITFNLFLRKIAQLLRFETKGGWRLGAIFGGILLVIFYRLYLWFVLIFTIIYVLFQAVELICTAQLPWRRYPRYSDGKNFDLLADIVSILPFSGSLCNFFRDTNSAPGEGICGDFKYHDLGFNWKTGLVAALLFSLNIGLKSIFFTAILNPLIWIIYFIYILLSITYTIFRVVFNGTITRNLKEEAGKGASTTENVPSTGWQKVFDNTLIVIWSIIYGLLSAMLIYNIVKPVNNINNN